MIMNDLPFISHSFQVSGCVKPRLGRRGDVVYVAGIHAGDAVAVVGIAAALELRCG